MMFCLYAEDAGIFGKRDMLCDYLKQFDALRFAGDPSRQRPRGYGRLWIFLQNDGLGMRRRIVWDVCAISKASNYQ